KGGIRRGQDAKEGSRRIGERELERAVGQYFCIAESGRGWGRAGYANDRAGTGNAIDENGCQSPTAWQAGYRRGGKRSCGTVAGGQDHGLFAFDTAQLHDRVISR